MAGAYAARFTIGGVCLLAARAFARRWLSISILCLVAGTAVSALGLLALLWPTPVTTNLIVAPWPVLEIARGVVPSIIAGPVIAVALLALAKPSQRSRPAYALILRRLPATTIVAILALLLVSEPGRFAVAALDASDPAIQFGVIAILFFYQAAVFALGHLMVAVMVTESSHPWLALMRATRLFRGHWLQVSLITLGLWALAYVMDQVGTSIALSIVLESFWGTAAVASTLAGIRIAAVLVVFAAVYYLLRIERDGPLPQDAAEVFD
jgi:hypothetical protein